MISIKASESPNRTCLRVTHILEALVVYPNQHQPFLSSTGLLIKAYGVYVGCSEPAGMARTFLHQLENVFFLHKTIVHSGEITQVD